MVESPAIGSNRKIGQNLDMPFIHRGFRLSVSRSERLAVMGRASPSAYCLLPVINQLHCYRFSIAVDARCSGRHGFASARNHDASADAILVL